MRVYALYAVLLGISVAGLRDWFIPYCGLIVLTAFMDRHDMPKTIMEISGLNPWNVLLTVTIAHWFMQRRAAGFRFDLPRGAIWLLTGYVAFIVVGYVRAAIDVDSFARGSMTLSSSDGHTMHMNYTISGLFIDELVNPLRYMVPALLMFDGVRDRRRATWGLFAILLMGAWYAFFVCKTIPLGVLTGADDPLQSRKRLQNEIGLHANDMAFVVVFMFWGMIGAWPLMKQWWMKVGCACSSAMTSLAVLLCQSRGGFLGFTIVGLGVIAVRKPKALMLVPIMVAGLAVVVPIACPGVVERMTTGFDSTSVSGENTEDWDQITAGRLTNLWPAALEWIGKSPLWGHGRYVMLRDPGLFRRVLTTEGSVPNHPHNAYLEVLLDYGAIALAIVLAMFIGIMRVGFRLTRFRDPLVKVVGTMAFAAALDNMVVGFSSRALLPRPSMMGMWCVFGLSMRLWVQSRQAAKKRWAVQRGPFPVQSVFEPEAIAHVD